MECVVLTLPIREVLPATSRASIVRIDLDGQRFPFLAGQALTIATHGYDGRRPYSLASAPADALADGYLELLVGLLPDGTPGPHLQLTPGTLVDIEGPLGRFTFPDDVEAVPLESRFLFVAGGTGIAPLRSMYRDALARGYRHLGVLYSARTPDDFAYESELTSLADQGALEVALTVTRDSDADWRGARGRISTDHFAGLLHGKDTMCFVCGPRSMVDDIPRALMALGVAAEQIRIEEW